MDQHAINILIDVFGCDPKEWRYTHISNRYLVSNFGEVISLIRKPRILKKISAKTGYHQVSIMVEGKPVKCYIHRLVSEVFISGKSEIEKTVNHINGIKTDNKASNLEWLSQAKNNKHSIESGLNNCYGENHCITKLKTWQVSEIKAKSKLITQRTIAAEYGISQQHVSDIVTGKKWPKHGL